MTAQTNAFAAKSPQLKPRVKLENASNYKPSKKQTYTKSSSAKIKTVQSQRTKPQKTKTYKDSAGNPISAKQKERSKNLKKIYKDVTKDEHIMEALDLLNGGLGEFSRRAILGNNLSEKPMQVDFEDLRKFGQAYANFDALG